MVAVGLRSKKKSFVIVFVTSAALLLLLVIVWLQQDSDVNATLSRAGFAKLPESARNARIDRQGKLFEMRVILVKFEADPKDILRFVKRHSSTTQLLLEGTMEVRYNGIVYPSWWLQWDEGRPQRTYFVKLVRYGGTATVSNENSMIYIQMMCRSKLLRKIKRCIPFI